MLHDDYDYPCPMPDVDDQTDGTCNTCGGSVPVPEPIPDSTNDEEDK